MNAFLKTSIMLAMIVPAAPLSAGVIVYQYLDSYEVLANGCSGYTWAWYEALAPAYGQTDLYVAGPVTYDDEDLTPYDATPAYATPQTYSTTVVYSLPYTLKSYIIRGGRHAITTYCYPYWSHLRSRPYVTRKSTRVHRYPLYKKYRKPTSVIRFSDLYRDRRSYHRRPALRPNLFFRQRSPRTKGLYQHPSPKTRSLHLRSGRKTTLHFGGKGYHSKGLSRGGSSRGRGGSISRARR